VAGRKLRVTPLTWLESRPVCARPQALTVHGTAAAQNDAVGHLSRSPQSVEHPSGPDDVDFRMATTFMKRLGRSCLRSEVDDDVRPHVGE